MIKSIRTGWTGISALAGNDQWFSDFESIASVTVGADGATSVAFSSIGTNWNHLQLRYVAMFTNGTAEFEISFNSNTTAGDYARHAMFGDGSSAGAVSATGSNTRSILYTRNTSSDTVGVSVVDILDYANTNKNKTVRLLSGHDYNGSGVVSLGSLLWMKTNAIDSITIQPSAGSIRQHSHFALYGIRG